MEPKFVQVTTSISDDGGCLIVALDAEGGVWFYDFDLRSWRAYSEDREDA
jgi:hypothetical protein